MPITIDGSGTVTGISAGGLPNGVIKAPDLDGAQTGTAPIYGCRAWVNFDGTRNEADTGASTNGANVKIKASGNVSSVLKNGTGDYTVTFTTAMVDANYTVVATGGSQSDANVLLARIHTLSTESARLNGLNTAFNNVDRDTFCVAIFR